MENNMHKYYTELSYTIEKMSMIELMKYLNDKEYPFHYDGEKDVIYFNDKEEYIYWVVMGDFLGDILCIYEENRDYDFE